MVIKDYNEASSEIKKRLIRLNGGGEKVSQEIAKISKRIYNILSQTKKSDRRTKYDGFIYEVKSQKPNSKRSAIYFDKIGFNEFQRKNERENIQIQTAYLCFIEKHNLRNILPNLLYKKGFFASYYGAWQAVENCRFSKRPEIRAFVLEWLKERKIEVKL